MKLLKWIFIIFSLFADIIIIGALYEIYFTQK